MGNVYQIKAEDSERWLEQRGVRLHAREVRRLARATIEVEHGVSWVKHFGQNFVRNVSWNTGTFHSKMCVPVCIAFPSITVGGQSVLPCRANPPFLFHLILSPVILLTYFSNSYYLMFQIYEFILCTAYLLHCCELSKSENILSFCLNDVFSKPKLLLAQESTPEWLMD